MAKSRQIVAFIVLLTGFIFSASVFAFPKKAQDFTLISPEGRLSLSQLKGQVVLIFFGFTACPDVCPISLSTISNVFHHLKAEELEKSKALFITLDPERDKVEMMHEYTGFFHPNIIGLTDEPRNISEVARLYGVKYQKKELERSALGYVINHTADIYLVDTVGMLIQRYPHDVDPKVLIRKIRSLFQDQG